MQDSNEVDGSGANTNSASLRSRAHLQPEGLKRDLQIWSSGLFPFFQYAATSVKVSYRFSHCSIISASTDNPIFRSSPPQPTLLNIYEAYYLPLQDALRPVMKALILALLPGLDEETGEFFDKVRFFCLPQLSSSEAHLVRFLFSQVVFLLDFVSSTVSPPFFLQNVWLILISTPSARILALNYLSRRMPKLGEGEGPFDLFCDASSRFRVSFSLTLPPGSSQISFPSSVQTSA